MKRLLLPTLAVLTFPTALLADFSLRDTPGQYLDILENGKAVARYQYGHDTSTEELREATYKPYLHLFASDGKTLITKGPGGVFPHHRGIFIGWNQIKAKGQSFDRWHMKGGDQIHVRFEKQEAGKDSATITAAIEWDGAAPGQPIIAETRTFHFRTPQAPAHVDVEVTSVLKALQGETVLGGDPEHAGVHFRPAADVDRTGTSYTYPVATPLPHKDLDYPWVGETFLLGGQKQSVVLFNNTSNPTGARFSAYRDYGRFGVMPKATLLPDKPLTLRHRFLASTGELPSPEQIHALSDDFNGQKSEMPKIASLPSEKGGPGSPKGAK